MPPGQRIHRVEAKKFSIDRLRFTKPSASKSRYPPARIIDQSRNCFG